MSLRRKSLFLVALLLDNAGLDRVLEIATGRDKGGPRYEDGDLCPRAVRILFEGIAGYFSEARGT
jgi:ribosomal protein S6E (S10)